MLPLLSPDSKAIPSYEAQILKCLYFSFLAHCLTLGNLLSGGVLALELQSRFKVSSSLIVTMLTFYSIQEDKITLQFKATSSKL